MDEILYERNGEIFSRDVLIAKFGKENLEAAIKEWGFKEVPKERLDSKAAYYYERNGEEFHRETLEAKFGSKTDEAIKKLGFKEVIKPQTWSQNITPEDNYDEKNHAIIRTKPVKKKEESPSEPVAENSESVFTSEKDKSLLESYATEVQEKRKGARENEDGTESTHKMAYAEEDGKYKVYPTVFQKEDGSWYEPDTKKDKWAALKEAKKKGEVYTFEKEEQAKAFAEGAWKDVEPKKKKQDQPAKKAGQKFTDEYANINDPEDIWWKTPDEETVASNKKRELATGSTRLGEAIAGYPNAVYRFFAAPFNAIYEATGNEHLVATPEKLSEVTGISNKVLDYYQEETKKLSAETDAYYKKKYGTDDQGNTKRSAWNAFFDEGDWSRGFEQLGGSVVESAPISVAMMAGGAAVGVSRLALYGTPAFVESSLEDLKRTDPVAYAKMSETERTVKAYGMAGAETVFASVVHGTLGKVYKDILTKEGKEAGKVIFKQGVVKLLETALKKYGAPVGALMEGIEEMATTVTQNMIQGKPAHLNVADSFLSGLASGGVFSAPLNIAKAHEIVKTKAQENKIKKIVDGSNYGDLTEAFRKADEDDIDDVQIEISGNVTSRKVLKNDLEKQVAEGLITQEEADQAIKVFDTAYSLNKATDGIDLTPEQKKKAINLLKEKIRLTEKIKDKDPNLVRKEIEEIGKIDEQLGKIRQDTKAPLSFNEVIGGEVGNEKLSNGATIRDLLDYEGLVLSNKINAHQEEDNNEYNGWKGAVLKGLDKMFGANREDRIGKETEQLKNNPASYFIDKAKIYEKWIKEDGFEASKEEWTELAKMYREAADKIVEFQEKGNTHLDSQAETETGTKSETETETGTKSEEETGTKKEDVDINTLVDKARDGDVEAQNILGSYGLKWEKEPVVRFVGQSEIDALNNNEKIEGKNKNAGVDVTKDTEGKNVPATNSDYRITFKEDGFDDKKEGSRVTMKGDRDGWIRDGYTLEDVQTIEKWNNDGTWTVTYDASKQSKPKPKPTTKVVWDEDKKQARFEDDNIRVRVEELTDENGKHRGFYGLSAWNKSDGKETQVLNRVFNDLPDAIAFANEIANDNELAKNSKGTKPKKPKPTKKATQPVPANPNPVVQTIKTTEKGKEWTVTRTDYGLKFVDKNGKEATAPTMRKLRDKYAEKFIYTFGKTANEAIKETNQLPSPDHLADIAEYSKNPAEVAYTLANNRLEDLIESEADYLERIIAQNLGYVSRKSFIENSDVNFITNSIGRSYFRPNGAPLDVIAQEMSETAGKLITEQDLVDFILKYPNGTDELARSIRHEKIVPLEDLFTKLTGLPPNDAYLEQAVNQKIEKELFESYRTSLDEMTDEELQQYAEELELSFEESVGQFRINEKEKGTKSSNAKRTKTKNRKGDDGRSGVRKKSSGKKKGSKQKGSVKEVYTTLNPDGKRVINKEVIKDKLPNAYNLIRKYRNEFDVRTIRAFLANRYDKSYIVKSWRKKHIAELTELEIIQKEFSQFSPIHSVTKAELKKGLKDSGNFTPDQLTIYNALIDNLKTDHVPEYVVDDAFEIKNVKLSGTNYFLPSGNFIRSKEPEAFAHEIGHWAFQEVLSPEDRIAYMNYMQEARSKNKDFLKENLAYTYKRIIFSKDGKKFEFTTNVSDNVNEYFAEQFRQWYLGKQATPKEVETLFQKVADYLRRVVKDLISGKFIDKNLEPFFEKILETSQPAKPKKSKSKKSKPNDAQTTLQEIARKTDKDKFLSGVHRVPLEGLDPKFDESTKKKVLSKKSRNPNAPVIVGFRDGQVQILDGAHRYYEAVQRGDDSIEVRFTINEGEEKFWEDNQAKPNLNSDLNRDANLVTERVKPKTRKTTKPLRKIPEVLADLVEALEVTLKYRRTGSKYTLGTYHPRTALVSIKNRGDFGTVAHELGHYLDDRFDISGTVPFAIQAAVDNSLKWFYDRGGSNPPQRANKAFKEAYLKREGMAEFVRAYVLNPEIAKLKAPELYQHFENVVNDKSIKALQKFSDEYIDHHNATNMEKIPANIESTSLKGKKGFREWYDNFRKTNSYGMNWLDNVKTEVANSLIPANKAYEFALALTGEKVSPKNNFEIVSRGLLGINQKINTAFSNGLVNAKNQFLKAEGGVFERGKDGQIIKPNEGTRMDINWLLAPLDSSSQKTLMKEMDEVVSYMVAQRTIEYAMKFNRIENLTGLSPTEKADAEVAIGYLEEFKELKKTNREKYDRILDAAERYRIYADAVLQYAVDKGRISQESYKTIKEGNKFYVALTRVKEDSPAQEVVNDLVTTAAGGAIANAKDVIRAAKGGNDFIQNPYTSLLFNTAAIIRESDRNEVMQAFINPIRKVQRWMGEGDQMNLAGIAMRSSMAYNQEKGVMVPIEKTAKPIYFEGEVEYWTLDQPIYDALTESSTSNTILAKVGAFLPTVIRNSVTHFPVFAVRNLTRDTFSRLIISRTNSGLKDMIHNATDQEAFDMFGASQSGFHLTDKDSYKEVMAMTIKNRTKNTMIPLDLRILGKGYMKLLEKGENINRIAEFKKAYKKARKEGLSDYEAGLYAAYQARDLMDFAVAGHTVRTLNRYIPFLNAGVQGLRRSWKGAKAKPIIFGTKMLAYTTIPTIIAQVMASVWDYEEEYEQLPAYQRDLYWNFKLYPSMEGFVTIPKPFELGFFSSVVDRSISKVVRGNDMAFRGLGNSFKHSFVPFSEYSYMEFAGMKPILESDFNKNSFTGNDIVPFWEEGRYLQDREGTKYASRISTNLSKGMQKLGWEQDPRKIDHIFQGYGTYFAAMILAVTDKGKKDSRHRLDLSKIGFYKKPPIANAMSVTRVSELASKMGYTRDKRVKKIRKYIDAYYLSEDKGERKRIMKKLYKFSEQTRLEMEVEAQKHLAGKPVSKSVEIE